jgi:hypothetical protein
MKCDAKLVTFHEQKREMFLIDEIKGKKNKNTRGINKFQNGYQTGSYLMDEKGDLLPDSNSILNKWKNHFYELYV